MWWEKLNQIQQKHSNSTPHDLHQADRPRCMYQSLVKSPPRNTQWKSFQAIYVSINVFPWICDLQCKKKGEASMINLRPCGMMFDWPVSTVPSGHHGRYDLAETWKWHYVSHLAETKLCETSWNFRGKNQRLNDIRFFWFEKTSEVEFFQHNFRSLDRTEDILTVHPLQAPSWNKKRWPIHRYNDTNIQ